MSDTNLFTTCALTDRIKLRPYELGRSIQESILRKLRFKFEGVCSYHGFIKPSSIQIVKCSMGTLVDYSLNGDVEYTISYSAEICNPVPGMLIQATVVNSNRFGILATTFVNVDGEQLPVINSIIPKEINNDELDNILPGNIINIEVVGRKFEINDKRVSVVGKIVRNKDGTFVLAAGTIADNVTDVSSDEEYDDLDDGDEDADEDGAESLDAAEDNDNDDDHEEDDDEDDDVEDDDGDGDGDESDDVLDDESIDGDDDINADVDDASEIEEV